MFDLVDLTLVDCTICEVEIGPDPVSVMGGVGGRWYWSRTAELEIRIEGTRQGKSQDIFQSRLLLCYTRERVKREEKEILQHQTTGAGPCSVVVNMLMIV